MSRYLLSSNIVFEPQQAKLYVGEQQVERALDNLEFKVLSHLIDNREHILSKAELLSLWPTAVVMDHSLARVLSSLRKKLDCGQGKSVIKTIPRQGYQYIGQYQPEIVAASREEAVVVDNFNYLTWLVAIVIFLSIVAIFFFQTDEPMERFLTSTVIDKQTQKQDLAPRYDGQLLAYSARALSEENWHLKVKNMASGRASVFKSKNANITNPIWVSKEQVVVIQESTNTEKCELSIVSLGAKLQANTLRECQQGKRILDVALSRGQQLVALVSDVTTGEQFIEFIDISSGERSDVLAQSSLSAAYQLASSPNGALIAVLSTEGWSGTKIEIYETDNFTQPVWLGSLPHSIYQLTLSDSEISYFNEFGNLVSVSLQSDQTLPINVAFTSAVYQPVIFENGYFVLEGQYGASTLYSHSESATVPILTIQDGNAELMKSFGDKSWLYVSAESGLSQLWLFDGNTHRQLTYFSDNLSISDFSVSTSMQSIALTISGDVSVFSLNESGQYIKHHVIKNAESPVFFGEQLWLLVYEDGQPLYQVADIGKQASSKRVIGVNSMQVSNGELYFTYEKENGLWRMSKSGEPELVTDIDLFNMQWQVVSDKLLTLDLGLLSRYDLTTRQLITEEQTPCVYLVNAPQVDCVYLERQAVANRIIRLTKLD
ncbi:transcriptional regulator [Thalassotalea euphylliae]|uniref:winged helix-turn-helix domain-containing protein n=1 Tax=Thalassotalea euphylliae TaxID=1655234 RepID=UPI00363AD0CC